MFHFSLRTAACLTLVAALLACQTPPPPAPQPLPPEPTQQEKQQQALLDLGFAPGDDGWELQMTGKILFEFDSDILSADAHMRVLDMARALQEVGIARLRVEGHTDNRGSEEYNLRLSERRAQAVADVLLDAGMVHENLEVKGIGSALPIDNASDEENRRVAIVVPLQ